MTQPDLSSGTQCVIYNPTSSSIAPGCVRDIPLGMVAANHDLRPPPCSCVELLGEAFARCRLCRGSGVLYR